MAHRLLADRVPLVLWNRTRARAEKVAARRPAVVVGSVDDVFERCPLVLVMVFDHAAAMEIIHENRERLANRTVALLTDLTPDESDELAALVT